MSRTRYCSTCGTLLSEGAAICGECGARYQASPYERRATDAPGAWSQSPRSRSRDLGPSPQQPEEDEGIQLISPEELRPRAPGATALRSKEQYDQLMVTQPPTSQTGPAASSGHPGGLGSPAAAGPAAPADDAAGEGAPMEPPLDGCVPGTPLKRFLAAVIDAVIAGITTLPLMIGLILIIVQDSATLLAQILVGVGAALPAAYTVLILWLVGAKGFTLGKLILGLRVTRFSQGGSIGILRSLGRWVLLGLWFPINLVGIVWLVMALSIFLDPKKHLRGFHDRAVDSVVVDVKAGRNPLKPRPDDFEREGAEHYLGAPSVAVTAHENLLTEPGAAWRDEGQAQHTGPQAQAPSSGWGPDPSSAPPYAPAPQQAPQEDSGQHQLIGSPWSPPPAPAAPSGGTDSWGPPPQQSWQPPVDEQPPASSQPPPPAGPPPQTWEGPPQAGPPQQPWADPQQQPWSQPPALSAPHGVPSPHGPYDAPQPGAPPSDDTGFPASSGQAWPPGVPAPPQAAPQERSQEQPPSARPDREGAPGVPSELTTDAWDDDAIDEDTRMAMPEGPDLGDLEQTRVSAVSLPPVPTLRLVTDDGTERSVQKAVVLGRNPSATEDEVLFVVKDDTRSVSKTHLRIDGTGPETTVTDLGSTNGSAIVRADGSRESLVPDTPTVLPAGASLTIGDRTVTVERVQ